MHGDFKLTPDGWNCSPNGKNDVTRLSELVQIRQCCESFGMQQGMAIAKVLP